MDKYIYRAKLVRVVDGDTFDAMIDLGFDTWIKRRIRLKGVDTWESRTRNKAEKKNHEAEIESIRSIYNYLHPFNINQERYLNFGNFYSSKGPSFINYIVEKISIMDDKILIIDLED